MKYINQKLFAGTSLLSFVFLYLDNTFNNYSSCNVTYPPLSVFLVMVWLVSTLCLAILVICNLGEVEKCENKKKINI